MSGTIAFIGAGNMASALIGGLIANGRPAASLAAVDILAQSRERIQATFGIKVFEKIAEVASMAESVVLAVKPQQMRDVAAALAPLLSGQLVVSIAAGIRMSDLSRWLDGYRKIVRVMPNTPALVSAGVSGLYADPSVSASERERAQAILDAVGETLWVEREELIDAVTAVSGSGPAYVFYFIEAMRQAALEMGFEKSAAQTLVMKTFSGSIKLAESSSDDVAVLRERVTSKGGTTERAVAAMNRAKVGSGIALAVHAARARAMELGDEMGKAD
jgi:pyrroline-5-carboxylate reductase